MSPTTAPFRPSQYRARKAAARSFLPSERPFPPRRDTPGQAARAAAAARRPQEPRRAGTTASVRHVPALGQSRPRRSAIATTLVFGSSYKTYEPSL